MNTLKRMLSISVITLIGVVSASNIAYSSEATAYVNGSGCIAPDDISTALGNVTISVSQDDLEKHAGLIESGATSTIVHEIDVEHDFANALPTVESSCHGLYQVNLQMTNIGDSGSGSYLSGVTQTSIEFSSNNSMSKEITDPGENSSTILVTIEITPNTATSAPIGYKYTIPVRLNATLVETNTSDDSPSNDS